MTAKSLQLTVDLWLPWARMHYCCVPGASLALYKYWCASGVLTSDIVQ